MAAIDAELPVGAAANLDETCPKETLLLTGLNVSSTSLLFEAVPLSGTKPGAAPKKAATLGGRWYH
jgi:hypothetical protein